MLSLSALISMGLVAGGLKRLGAEEPVRRKRVLFFTKSAGWEHSVIKQEHGQPSFAEKILNKIGPDAGLEFTCTKDGSLISAEYLSRFDALFFYTTGNLGLPAVDGSAPVSPEGKRALLDAIAAGKGFVGCHSATDTYHTGEHEMAVAMPRDLSPRYQTNGENSDPFVRMLGGEFIKHGAQQTARLHLTDPNFPGAKGLDNWELHEEWYSLKDFAPDLHVILVQDTAGMTEPVYQRRPYPCTWARRHEKGRVFYTSLGHREDVWENPMFQGLLLGGLRWAAGLVEAEVKPNLTQAAPGYADIPPQDPPKKD